MGEHGKAKALKSGWSRAQQGAYTGRWVCVSHLSAAKHAVSTTMKSAAGRIGERSWVNFGE